MTFERVNFFAGRLLTSDDLATEQNYSLRKRRIHNRMLHGWGVVSGLDVTAGLSDSGPTVQVGSGYALTPWGHEICVPKPVLLALASWGQGAKSDPCDPGAVSGGTAVQGSAYLAIKYSECLAAALIGLEGVEEYSRVRDGFEFGFLAAMPSLEPPSLTDLFDGSPGVDLSSGWVVLAQITVPERAASSEPSIDMSVRRMLESS